MEICYVTLLLERASKKFQSFEVFETRTFLNCLFTPTNMLQSLYQRSVDLQTKLSCQNFSQKTNERIWFSILTTRKYLKSKNEFQVFPSVRIEKHILRSFLGEVVAQQFLFRDLLTFNICNNLEKGNKKPHTIV